MVTPCIFEAFLGSEATEKAEKTGKEGVVRYRNSDISEVFSFARGKKGKLVREM